MIDRRFLIGMVGMHNIIDILLAVACRKKIKEHKYGAEGVRVRAFPRGNDYGSIGNDARTVSYNMHTYFWSNLKSSPTTSHSHSELPLQYSTVVRKMLLLLPTA